MFGSSRTGSRRVEKDSSSRGRPGSKATWGFRPNPAHGIKSIGSDPIMFNSPEELVEAILSAARKQGVTVFNWKTKKRLT